MTNPLADLTDAIIKIYGSIENVPSLLKMGSVEGMPLKKLKEKSA